MNYLWIGEIIGIILFWMILHFGVKKILVRSRLEILKTFLSVVTGFIALLLILQILDFDVVPLITFGGIGAAAIGFASKDIISNFFGALMLYTTRPFAIGDFIELPEKKIMGNVETIGWYHTAVRDLQKRPVYIPNSAFPVGDLINWSRITHRRIDETFAISIEDADKIQRIVESIRSYLKNNSAIDSHQPILVFFQSYRDAALEVILQAYTLSTRYEEYMEVKQQVLLQAKKIVDQVGATFARPIKLFSSVQAEKAQQKQGPPSK